MQVLYLPKFTKTCMQIILLGQLLMHSRDQNYPTLNSFELLAREPVGAFCIATL
ncbi:hypothetical protein GOP47_0025859, partial [Adiantum capillus-veneris]